MQVVVENMAGLERKMTLTISATSLAEQIAERVRKTAQTVKLKGFRPGHVPIAEVNRRFGEGIRLEAIKQGMLDGFMEVVKEQSIRLAGAPQFEPLEQFQKNTDEDFSFHVTFEILPEVELADFSELKLTSQIARVTDLDVDSAVEEMKKSRQSFTETLERAAQLGDRITVDWLGKAAGADGKSKEEATRDLPLVLDPDVIPANIIDKMVGTKVGDVLLLELPSPAAAAKTSEKEADKEGEGKAGKTKKTKDKKAEDSESKSPDTKNTITCTVKLIEAPDVQNLDDEFLTSLGITKKGEEGIAEFRQRLRDNLETRVERASWQELKAQALRGLVDLHQQIELPKVLVEQEVKRLQQNRDGGTRDQAQATEESSTEKLLPVAEQTVKLRLVMEKFISEQKLEVTEEAIRQRIMEVAGSYGDPQEVMRWYYGDEQRLGSVRDAVLEDQALRKVVDFADVSEEAVDCQEMLKKPNM